MVLFSHLHLRNLTLFVGIFGFLFIVVLPVSAVNTGWQPVNVTSWAQIDVPPGWTYGSIEVDPTNPDQATLEAVAPNGETKIQYVFHKNLDPATAGELRRNQDRYMSSQGFCLCGDQPSFIENEDQTTMKQVYFKGTEEGAVVCSAAYPGWGRYQYAIVMDGTNAVSSYFDDLPDTLADHIRPITPVNSTVS